MIYGFDEIVNEKINEIQKVLKDNCAMSFFDALPDDNTKKLIYALIRKGCSPSAVFEAIIEINKEDNKNNKQESQ